MSWKINISQLMKPTGNYNDRLREINIAEKKDLEMNFIKYFDVYKQEILNPPNQPFESTPGSFIVYKNRMVPNNKFSGTDTKEAFEENLKVMSENWRYRTKDITYNVNRDGYRTYEWNDINDWNESIVLFGCSCTFGIGLAEDETISHHLEKLTGRRVINLGVPGGSNYVIVNNCASLINSFGTPYAAVFNWTSHDRMRYYHEQGYIDIGSWNKNKTFLTLQESPWKIKPGEILNLTNKNPFNSFAIGQNMKKSVLAMLKDCKNVLNITFFSDAHSIMQCEKFFPSGMGAGTIPEKKARDLLHPGNDSVFEMAQYIHERLSQNN